MLSLPPENLAKRPINLGTIIYEKEKWPLGISPDELLQHMLIVGRSGSGKTNLISHLLSQLTDRRVPWLFLDVKRTARDLIPVVGRPVRLFTAGRDLNPLPFNPFVAPPGLEPIVHVHHVVDVLSEAFALGDGARSLILRILSAALEQGEPSLTPDGLIQRLDALAVTGREHAWRSSARRALQSLIVSGLSAGSAAEQGSFLNSLLTNNTIIELDALSAGVRKFLVPLLLLNLYHVGLLSGNRETLRIAVALDESHHYFLNGPRRAREPLMHTILRQCREMGMALILAGQTISATAPVARGNTFATIVMNTKDPAD
ncbi:MAG: DUF87 domain-containing protein, partial [Phycisphaerae bacterium]|nr:DUF87 domain-containing protein [Phycisphaerae bacterium]